jgi:hypothetical protein
LVFGHKNDSSYSSLAELGEYVVVVGPDTEKALQGQGTDRVSEIFGLITEHVTTDADDATRATAAILRLHERQVRKALKQARFSERRAEDATS